MGILLRLAASAAAVWVATMLVPGISVTAETLLGKIGTFVAIAVIFGLCNAFIRPIVKMVGCGLYVFTLGLIALVVNGALFMLTSFIAGLLDVPFHVDDFWPAAILGALVVGLTSWALNWFIED
ncbi:phage holin family protein [Catellatospora sp. NPDC049111]|jgi:putative membrane protein|uniref:Phage holin family protein n=1 Tax=Catellatospora aurea TaxID=1337874 RepID=A0ABW2GXA3_9ACTN